MNVRLSQLHAEVTLAVQQLVNLADAYRELADAATTPNPKPTVCDLLAAPTFRAGVDYIRFTTHGDPRLIGVNPQWGALWEIDEADAEPGFEPGYWRPALIDLDASAELVPAPNYRAAPVTP